MGGLNPSMFQMGRPAGGGGIVVPSPGQAIIPTSLGGDIGKLSGMSGLGGIESNGMQMTGLNNLIPTGRQGFTSSAGPPQNPADLLNRGPRAQGPMLGGGWGE